MLFRRRKPETRTVSQSVDGGTGAYALSPEGRATIDQNGAAFLHIRRGVVFASNHIGARIWQGLAGRRSPEQIAAELSREFGVPQEQVARDTAEFIADLVAQGFVTREIGA